MRHSQLCDDRSGRRGAGPSRRAGHDAADEPEIVVEAGATRSSSAKVSTTPSRSATRRILRRPDMSALRQDFDVVSTGDESHNQSSTFIINGKVTQQNSFGHAYRFRLTPEANRQAGDPGPIGDDRRQDRVRPRTGR